MTSLKTVLLAAVAVSALTSTALTGTAQADVVVGVAGPMTGSNAAFGEQYKRGAEKAIADINAKGGVLGQKLKLEVGDDACDPKQAVNVANDMVGKKAAVVIGHFCSSSSIPASGVYVESNTIQISPGSTNPTFTERGMPDTFRVCGRDDAQGPTAAKYVAEHFKGKKVAIVHDKSAYGKGLADEFQKALNGLGVKEVTYDAITVGDKDFSPLIAKLKELKAEVVYFGGYETEGGLIVRQAADQGLKATLVSGDALVTEQFWAITGPSGAGTLMTFGPDPRLNPKNAELVKSFRAENYEPEAYTLYTYGAIQAWAQAAAKAGSFDSVKVEASLKANKFDTVLGDIGFDAKGDITAPGYVFYVWKDGKYVYAD
jgi:branched-chain amino acid transport system substrate-binding protein